MVSKFIVGTCQLLPKSYDFSDCMHNPMAHAIHCGSTMEFYIRPLHKCIADIDALLFNADELAFEGDFPVLPLDVSCLQDTIKCFKIESYIRCPGFVRLRLIGEMKYNWKYKKYEFSHETLMNKYCKFDIVSCATNLDPNKEQYGAKSHDVRGPAITLQYDEKRCSLDNVHSMWCPQWPREAKEWSRRHRNFGWPTIDTISEVLQYGCHVVYVQHRSCRDDEHQLRLSFSVAEVILLQSWTKIQQIVYHLLRFFAKRELIQEDCPKEDEVLCTYHLKTLMLWTCEEMSPEWWTISSVIAIACELLQKLSEWLKKGYFPNYFIPEANLFHLPLRSTRLEKIQRQLNDFVNCGILCHWFAENYILPSIRTYIVHGNTSGLTLTFVDYILPISKFQQTLKPKSLDFLFSRGIMNSKNYIVYLIKFQTPFAPKSCLTYSCIKRKFDLVGLSAMAMLPMPESVCCFTFFDTALCSLNAVYGLESGKLAWDSELFVEYIKGFCWKPKSVRCQFHRLPIPITTEGSQFQFWQAQHFMGNLTGLNSPSGFQLLSLLSKGLLIKALECDDSQSNGIASAAVMYLAALHFASLENRIVMALCSAVLKDRASHMEDETLSAGCLFFIDDVVRIVGFCLLCKRFKENKHLTRRQIYLDLRLTPKVFAYYLTIKFLRKCSNQLELNPHLPISRFSLDQFLLALTKRMFCTLMKSSICLERDRQCVYRRTESVTSHLPLSSNLLTVTDKVTDALTNPNCIVLMNSGTRFNAARQGAYRRMDSLTANVLLRVKPFIIEETLLCVLMEYALENITSFYRAIREDFGIQCNTIDCYRALYLYKCRQYDEVLHLCERILKEPDLRSDKNDLALTNVLVIPSLHLFFDGDVQSLLGFHSLFFYLSSLVDNMLKFRKPTQPRLETLFALSLYCSRNRLIYCFSLPGSIKCHYSVGRHFLAKYLKLRCCIDCNYLCRQELAEFAAMKCTRPFEYIIYRFLQQTPRKDQK